uniref:Uncharacterized protein n=1 Tax=Panagrolaimus superbus TaxID=310955 RepID=A0A914Z830_9BILA
MMSEKPVEHQNSRVVIIARPSDTESARRRESPAYISEQVIYPETDTFCLLPSRMRFLCILLTILLIISLAAAIGNSIQSAGFKSTSFCKADWQDFGPDVLCPKETMVHYFICCEEEFGSTQKLVCCAQFKIWLL